MGVLFVILGLAMVSCIIIAKCIIELGKIPAEIMRSLKVGKDAIKNTGHKSR